MTGPLVEDYEAGVLAGDRGTLARAITLVESRRPDHHRAAQELLVRLLPRTGGAHRVGITGVPGSGKSTLIDALGCRLVAGGHRLAVLAVDPSSTRTGGSILGDKTRMGRLAAEDAAYIRPSPSAGTLGGVARRSRETLLLCEAAGFDVVLVETVGVGQSETVVAEMVDFFCLLTIAGGGDELQGIKKGALELADLVAVNKADGEDEARARRAARDLESALRLLTPVSPTWQPPVVSCSALEERGVDELWAHVERHRELLGATGELEARRREQERRWMWRLLEERLLDAVRHHPRVAALLPRLEADVLAGRLTPTLAVEQALAEFGITTAAE